MTSEKIRVFLRHESGFTETYISLRHILQERDWSERRQKYFLQKVRTEHSQDEWLRMDDGYVYLHEECVQWIDDVFENLDLSLTMAETLFVKKQLRKRAARLRMDGSVLEPLYRPMKIRDLMRYFKRSEKTIRRHIRDLKRSAPNEVQIDGGKILVSAAGVAQIEKKMEPHSYIAHLYELNRIFRALEIDYGT